ncbi:MAG: ribonuclease R [Acidiferrobacterales bacterium]
MSTKKNKPAYKDPQAVREAQNYEFPVPSRELILSCLAEIDEPLSFEQIADSLGVTGDRDIEGIRRRLKAMERDGQLFRNRRGLYGHPDKMDMVCGTIIAHPDGFGFLAPEDNSADLFLSSREMRRVMHGDRVMGTITGVDKRGRREGAIVEVLEHRHQQVVGKFIDEDNMTFVAPGDKRLTQDISIPPENRGDAREGQIVVAEIVRYSTGRHSAVGRIVEVMGDHMAPGMEIDVAIRKFELPNIWPQDVIQEAATYGEQVSEEAKTNRKDVRSLPLVTIDGEDARDFDDAIYCERNGKGWRLLVAIADVSHYVAPDSRLDREAYKRGNSVYFPERVIPMLPEVLSNGLCSLNPDVDRLCMVCDMRIDAKGNIKGFEFYEAVMRSHARLTYNQVASMLVDDEKSLKQQYGSVLPHLEELFRLYKTLHKVRLKRGAVDFDLPENKIVFDANRKVARVIAVERNDAHRIIEECMLAANVCAAEFLLSNKIPSPFRVHAGPTEEKLTALRDFLFEFGLSLSGGLSPEASDYAAVLKQIGDWPEARLIQTVMLRSLSQAIYSPDNIGHFALAYASYAHFTSPIRRFPDLIVHRSIKYLLRKKPGRGKVRRLLESILGGKPDADMNSPMRTLSEHCSMTGRRADEAVWDVIKWLKTEYMMDRVGENFKGLITGVTNFGVFVELGEVFAEGLVHVTALGNDYYHFDPQRHCLVGERSGKQLQLGDEVLVKVLRVDLDEAKIDLELVEQVSRPKRRAQKRNNRNDKTGKKKKAHRKGKQTSASKQKSSGKQAGKKSAKKKTSKKKHRKSRGGSKRR